MPVASGSPLLGDRVVLKEVMGNLLTDRLIVFHGKKWTKDTI